MNGINIVLKAVPSKTTMPILECILIDAVSDEIKLTGNDMELGIETKVEGTILERGKIALDAMQVPMPYYILPHFLQCSCRHLNLRSMALQYKDNQSHQEVLSHEIFSY